MQISGDPARTPGLSCAPCSVILSTISPIQFISVDYKTLPSMFWRWGEGDMFCSYKTIPVLGSQRCFSIHTEQQVSIVTVGQEVYHWQDPQMKIKEKKTNVGIAPEDW